VTEEELAAALPHGAALEQAITDAKAGRLQADGFGRVLREAVLMVAVVAHEQAAEQDTAAPFVIEHDGQRYGVAFTSPEQWDRFSAQTPFVLLGGEELGRGWPADLGLAINPGSSPSMLLRPEHLRAVLGAGAAGPRMVPAGAGVRVGAPDPGLPPEALEVLRQTVRADPAVRAAYQLAVAIDDGPVELAVGVEATPPYRGVAEGFADSVLRRDGGFRGVTFLDLDGPLLRSAQGYATPLQ